MEFKGAFLDSFFFWIPSNCIQKVPNGFYDTLAVINTETGEVEDTYIKPFEFTDKHGFTYRIKTIDIPKKGKFTGFFVSKKLLDVRYYLDYSITSYQLLAVAVDYYRKVGFSIPDIEFIYQNGFFNDFDFAIDFLESTDFFDHRLNDFKKQNSNGRIFYSSPSKYLEQKKRVGIQYGGRSNATIVNPFVKFYSKILELHNRSTDFYNALLINGVYINPLLRRCEVTIKNKAHIDWVFKKIGLVFSDYRQIFDLQDFQIRKIVNLLVGQHLRPVSEKISKNLSDKSIPNATNFMLGLMTYEFVNQGYTVENVVNLFETDIYKGKAGDVAKSRLKNRIINGFNFVRKLKNAQNIRVTASDAFMI